MEDNFNVVHMQIDRLYWLHWYLLKITKTNPKIKHSLLQMLVFISENELTWINRLSQVYQLDHFLSVQEFNAWFLNSEIPV